MKYSFSSKTGSTIKTCGPAIIWAAQREMISINEKNLQLFSSSSFKAIRYAFPLQFYTSLNNLAEYIADFIKV